MTTLSIYRYDTPSVAERMVRLIEARSGPRLAVDDAAVLTWPGTADRPTAWQATPLSARHALAGAFWGLLFAHLFLIPLSYAEPPGTTLAQSDDALAPLGLNAQRLDAIRSLLTPGTSAVLALHDDESLTALSAVVAGRYQPSIAIPLDPVQSRRLLAGFAESSGVAVADRGPVGPIAPDSAHR